MGAGMFFCRHPDSVAETFRVSTSYMPAATPGPAVDSYTNSVQWSRRFIGLKLFVALAHDGESGYIDRIEHQARMGATLKQALQHSGWRIVNNTPLPLVCFARTGLDITRFVAALQESQIAWMSETQLGGIPVVRACITSFRTSETDIAWVVGEMNRLVESMESR